VRTFESIY
jgi:hypothetical protein